MRSPAFLTPTPATASVRSPVDRRAASGGVVDRSLLRKLEVHRPIGGPLGAATLADDGGWWCPITPSRGLLLGGEAPPPEGSIDLTCAYAALELVGPDSIDLLARFCALDVRPQAMGVGAFRPGSVARTPGYVLRTGPESLLLLVGWALGEYLYDVITEARVSLGA